MVSARGRGECCAHFWWIPCAQTLATGINTINLCLSRGLFLALGELGLLLLSPCPAPSPPAPAPGHFRFTELPERALGGRRGSRMYTARGNMSQRQVPPWTETRRPRVWPWMRQVLFSALVSHVQNKRVAVDSLLPAITFSSYSGAWLNGLVIGHIQCEGLNWDRVHPHPPPLPNRHMHRHVRWKAHSHCSRGSLPLR